MNHWWLAVLLVTSTQEDDSPLNWTRQRLRELREALATSSLETLEPDVFDSADELLAECEVGFATSEEMATQWAALLGYCFLSRHSALVGEEPEDLQPLVHELTQRIAQEAPGDSLWWRMDELRRYGHVGPARVLGEAKFRRHPNGEPYSRAYEEKIVAQLCRLTYDHDEAARLLQSVQTIVSETEFADPLHHIHASIWLQAERAMLTLELGTPDEAQKDVSQLATHLAVLREKEPDENAVRAQARLIAEVTSRYHLANGHRNLARDTILQAAEVLDPSDPFSRFVGAYCDIKDALDAGEAPPSAAPTQLKELIGDSRPGSSVVQGSLRTFSICLVVADDIRTGNLDSATQWLDELDRTLQRLHAPEQPDAWIEDQSRLLALRAVVSVHRGASPDVLKAHMTELEGVARRLVRYWREQPLSDVGSGVFKLERQFAAFAAIPSWLATWAARRRFGRRSTRSSIRSWPTPWRGERRRAPSRVRGSSKRSWNRATVRSSTRWERSCSEEHTSSPSMASTSASNRSSMPTRGLASSDCSMSR